MSKNQGFTLIELMIVVAILGILATLAAPSFTRLYRDQQMSGAANALLSDIAFTRSEAIRRGKNVSTCPSTDADQASPTCTGNDWSRGWIVFVDNDGDGVRDTSGVVDEVLRVATAPAGVTSAFSKSGTNDVNFLRYNANGNSPGLQRNIQLTNGTADLDRVMCVASSGRPRLQKGSAC